MYKAIRAASVFLVLFCSTAIIAPLEKTGFERNGSLAYAQKNVLQKKPNPAAAEQPIRLTVLFFNDLHGQLLPYKVKDKYGKTAEVGGIARISALVKKIRSENEAKGIKTILLVAGDILQGTAMSTLFKGEPDILAFNAMGVDAMTVGNHEFDFGMESLLRLKKRADFPVISSNIVWKDSGDTMNEPSASFRLTGGIIVTVIGATTTDLLCTTLPDNVKKLIVINPVEPVTAVYIKAETLGPVLLLSHNKHEADKKIAKALPGLTAVIGGHDQILFDPHKTAGGVPIYQAFEKGRYLGRLDIAIDAKTKKGRVEKSRYIPITAGMDQDDEAAALIESYNKKISKSLKRVIGESAVFMNGERESIRYEETNLGNFIADVMREYTGSAIALINAGSIRGSLVAGPITAENIWNIMPFPNELMVVTCSGREIAQALYRSVQGDRDDEDGGFLHVSGISFKIRGKKAEDIQVTADASILDPQKKYTVAVNDFMYKGGDGYTMFAGKKAVKTGLPLREILVEVIRKRGTITAKTEGRITRIE